MLRQTQSSPPHVVDQSNLLMHILQEYVDYYGGAGVQHIAMNTDDIITAVSMFIFLFVSNLGNDFAFVIPSAHPLSLT
jgi:hypothetical protein